MSKKHHFFVLFLVVGIAILVPAIQYGKASLHSVGSENPLPLVSPVSDSISAPEPIKSEPPVEIEPALDKKTEEPTASTPKKSKPIGKSVKSQTKKPTSTKSTSTPAEITTESVETKVVVQVSTPNQDPSPEPPSVENVSCEISTFKDQFLCLINEHRAKNNRGPLRYDSQLSATARLHSQWMNESGITSHIGENGSKFYERCVATGTACLAENIAMGFTSASHLFELWKNSPGHNASMLGNYSYLGLGIYADHATTLFR